MPANEGPGSAVAASVPPERGADVPGSGEDWSVLCEGLRKRFGSLTVLDGLDLRVMKGSVFGLLGPNGAGKTTLIRILLGLTAPSAGTATVLGARVPPRSVLNRVGYMPQDLAISLDLTVEQNLFLFGRLHGVPERDLGPRSREVLALVDLEKRRRSLASELSGGMRRRVSLAATLLPNPDLLLLDEPTVGVDPELRAAFWDHFRALNRRGKTVLITTHYMEEAAHCDRIALLHEGAALFEGPPAEVLSSTGRSSIEDAFLALVLARKAGAVEGGRA